MIICKCLRCGHEWASRKLSRPDRCAGCYAKYWWREKRAPRVYTTPGPVGRPHKYPVHLLNIGQTLTVDHTISNPLSARQAIAAYGRRSGRRFEVGFTPAGMSVKRIL